MERASDEAMARRLGELVIEAYRVLAGAPMVSRRSGPAVDPVARALSAEEVERFEELRAWRANVAKKKGVPAYRVVTNRVLLDLIRERPRSEAALRAIAGVGDATVAHYGKALLAKLAEVA